MLENTIKEKYKEYREKCLEIMFELTEDESSYVSDLKKLIQFGRKIVYDEESYVVKNLGNIIQDSTSDRVLYNFEYEDGSTLPDWYDNIYVELDGCVLVEKSHLYNYIDLNGDGKPFFKEWFKEYSIGYYQKFFYSNYMDNAYSVLYSSSIENKKCVFFDRYLNKILMIYYPDGESDIEILDEVLKDIHESNIKKEDIIDTGYSYTLKRENIKLKYKPIYKYEFHILCEDESSCYMYDIKNKKYTKLGSKEDIIFYNNMIINKKEKEYKYFYSGNGEFIDISPIYEKKLKYATSIKYHKANILSYEQFKTEIQKNPDYDSLLETVLAQVNQNFILQKRLEEERTKQENKKKLETYLSQLKSVLENIETLSRNIESSNIKREKLPIGFIFFSKDEHLEIKEEYKKVLRFIDLSLEDFTNVNISGIDFENTNANIDPQTVYNKDMSNGNFVGVLFGPFANFNKVNIKGAKFGNGLEKNSIIEFVNFNGAITDDTTTIENVR